MKTVFNPTKAVTVSESKGRALKNSKKPQTRPHVVNPGALGCTEVKHRSSQEPSFLTGLETNLRLINQVIYDR